MSSEEENDCLKLFNCWKRFEEDTELKKLIKSFSEDLKKKGEVFLPGEGPKNIDLSAKNSIYFFGSF